MCVRDRRCNFSRKVVQDSCDPTNCSPPGSSVSEIPQAKILVWVAISFSRGSSDPSIKPMFLALEGEFFTTEPSGKWKRGGYFVLSTYVKHIQESFYLNSPLLLQRPLYCGMQNAFIIFIDALQKQLNFRHQVETSFESQLL